GPSGDIDLLECDTSLPVFVRFHTDAPELLDENNLIAVVLYSLNGYGLELQNTDYCLDGVCQGFFVGITVPDDPNDPDTEPELRWHKKEFIIDQNGFYNFEPLCLPTEYFENGNYLTDFIFKFQFFESDGQYNVSPPDLESIWDQATINQNGIESYHWNQFSYGTSWGNYLLLHDFGTFPNQDNYTDFVLTADPPVDYEADISFIVQYGTSLTFQPYTRFVGANIEGSDSLTYNVNIVNEQGAICMNAFIELVFDGGEHYVHNGGKVDSDPGSCMRFEIGAGVVVGENALLEYGESGSGMFAMHGGSSITLNNGAGLKLNCPLTLWDNPWHDHQLPVDVYLHEGSTFSFGNCADLRRVTPDSDIELVFHLMGGIVDFSALNDDQLSRIKVAYAPVDAPLEVLYVAGNPVNESLSFAVHSEDGSTLHIHVFDSAGRLVCDQKRTQNAGFNSHRIETSTWNVGLYIVKIDNGNLQRTFRIEKI
ncbi:MAG: T9SS type A sorting domain-containing protein, partial [Flavobacteriales bacterium]|nr:T9SS type A sorting domain-containing protein [Flavobacteriales bacterium]